MRMMRRQEIVPLVNRTCVPLHVMDDGIPTTLKPGYRKGKDNALIGAGPMGRFDISLARKVATAAALAARSRRTRRLGFVLRPGVPNASGDVEIAGMAQAVA